MAQAAETSRKRAYFHFSFYQVHLGGMYKIHNTIFIVLDYYQSSNDMAYNTANNNQTYSCGKTRLSTTIVTLSLNVSRRKKNRLINL